MGLKNIIHYVKYDDLKMSLTHSDDKTEVTFKLKSPKPMDEIQFINALETFVMNASDEQYKIATKDYDYNDRH